MPHPIPHWYIPSFYGDIRLEALTKGQCLVIAEKTTDREREALKALVEMASKRQWLPTSTSPAPLFNEGGILKTKLEAPIAKVAAQLAKLLKPNRKIISAVRFADGMIEEIHGESESTKAAQETPSIPQATAIAAAYSKLK